MKHTINFDQRILLGLSSLVSKDQMKDAMTHVYLEMIYDKEDDTFYPQWTATDGYVLATIKDETPQNDETITAFKAERDGLKKAPYEKIDLIPFTLQLTPETKKSIFDKKIIENALVVDTEMHIYTFIGKGANTEIRQYDDYPSKYPDYRSVIPEKTESEPVPKFGIDAEILYRFKALSHAYDLPTTPVILQPTGKNRVIRVRVTALDAHQLKYEALIMPIRID